MNSPPRWLVRLIPIIGWLPRYRSASFLPDLTAGITLAAYAVPVAMAYATLAGLAPQAGLYCYIFSGFAYALFASSRHLSVGPIASISVMVATVVGSMAAGDPTRYAAIAAMTACMVAAFCFLAWILRLSSFVNFISESVLLGFKAGAVLSIALIQIPKLIGVTGGGESFFWRLIAIFQQLGSINLTVLALGTCSLLLLLVGNRYLPGRPVALVVVLVSTGIVSVFGLTEQGVQVVGAIQPGLPSFEVPSLQTGQMEGLLELSFACFLLSYVESIAAARTFASKYHYQVDPRQELLGLGAANFVAAFGHGYPVAGGFSQSAVNEKAGARTPLSLVFASITLVIVLYSVASLLRNLPEAVLAAVVIVAISGFVKLDDFKKLRMISRVEFNVALVAFVGVLLFGILKGVTVSAIASILFLLRMMANPHIAVLGRIPGSIRFSDAARHTTNERFSGLFLFRIEAPLLYFNVDTICTMVFDAIHREKTAVRLAVCDLSTSPYIDAAGARMLQRLEEELERQKIQFRVAEAHAEAREILRATGISEALGGVSRYTALADIVEDFERDNRYMETAVRITQSNGATE
ncbi:MAG: SulP family inorganic anion transporter [Desulfuromonadaceae bacterium]|nr:SulP family inorganic anion transporter [Desulfuromonadaceae bacterium]MDD5105312.1 SulP family inorganic anion transporter [Desulfuromonadaceae bacterium]